VAEVPHIQVLAPDTGFLEQPLESWMLLHERSTGLLQNPGNTEARQDEAKEDRAAAKQVAILYTHSSGRKGGGVMHAGKG
jgi:hypothetical protein